MSYRGFEKLQCTLTTSGNISEYMKVERHLLVISDRLNVLKQQKLSYLPISIEKVLFRKPKRDLKGARQAKPPSVVELRSRKPKASHDIVQKSFAYNFLMGSLVGLLLRFHSDVMLWLHYFLNIFDEVCYYVV